MERILDEVASAGGGIVVAPAGAGKTTLLARALARHEGRSGWLRADHGDSDPDRFLAGLTQAGGIDGSPTDIDEWIAAAEEQCSDLLLVVDDVHTLAGSASAKALQRLVHHMPGELTLLLGSRPGSVSDLTLAHLSKQLAVVDAEALRFRLWETEQLYHRHYGDRLPPEDIARLNQLTGGWAAALHLFHAATHNRGLLARRRTLSDLRGRTQLTDAYLAGNVIDTLPDELAEFFVATSVLGTLSATVCDKFLDSEDSRAYLLELERRGLLTQLDDGRTYSCHEVLRSHLETRLMDACPAGKLADKFNKAGLVLEGEGLTADAVRAYARSGDFFAVTTILEREGGLIAGEVVSFDSLPDSLQNDPWLMLSRARTLVLQGDLWAAKAVYEQASADARGRGHAMRQLRDLRVWTQANPPPVPSPSGYLRQATIGRPRAAARACEEFAGAESVVASAAAWLISGDRRSAERLLARALRDRDLDDIGVNRIRALELVSEVLEQGQVADDEIDQTADLADKTGCPSTARLVLAIPALSGDPRLIDRARVLAARAEACGDMWGTALAHLAAELGVLQSGDPSLWNPTSSAERFDELGAPVLALWAKAAELCVVNQPSAGEIRALDARARELDVPGVRMIALRGLAELDRRATESLRTLVRELGGYAWLGNTWTHRAAVDITCFGEFRVRANNGNLLLADLRPKARELLRLLAVQGGRLVSAETLGEQLWAGGDSDRTKRSLHVAVSAVRSWFGSAGVDGAVVRDADSYGLDPVVVSTDVARLRVALVAAAQHESAGERSRSIDSWSTILRIAESPLLVDDQGVDWFGHHAQHLIESVIAAARKLAAARAADGRFDLAADACRRGLVHDRYRDELWQMRIDALHNNGERAAAARAQGEYSEVLRSLGL